MVQKRKVAYRAGMRAEFIAALFMMLKGYRVLAHRHKTSVGEVDLIVANGRRLAFIEVKARSGFDEAFSAVTLQQQQRIKRAATLWLAKQGATPRSEIGFDVIAVVPWKIPRHQKDAFSHTVS